MLITIEKVIILKTTEIFSELPDSLLVNIVSILKEVNFSKEETIFKKGDIGSSMFVIIDGKVRVHDGENTFAVLGPRDVFGELAALDTETRSATITTLENTNMFKIEQEMLYGLMAEHIGVARGIIRVLCKRVRHKLE